MYAEQNPIQHPLKPPATTVARWWTRHPPLQANGVTPVLKPVWDYMLLHEAIPITIEATATNLTVTFSPGTLQWSVTLTNWIPDPSAQSPLVLPLGSLDPYQPVKKLAWVAPGAPWAARQGASQECVKNSHSTSEQRRPAAPSRHCWWPVRLGPTALPGLAGCSLGNSNPSGFRTSPQRGFAAQPEVRRHTSPFEDIGFS